MKNMCAPGHIYPPANDNSNDINHSLQAGNDRRRITVQNSLATRRRSYINHLHVLNYLSPPPV